jgi:hypothetical protein
MRTGTYLELSSVETLDRVKQIWTSEKKLGKSEDNVFSWEHMYWIANGVAWCPY